MPKRLEGPRVFILDVQVRNEAEQSFVLLCEGRDMTPDQFHELMTTWQVAREIVVTFPTSTYSNNLDELAAQMKAEEDAKTPRPTPYPKSFKPDQEGGA